MNWVAYHSTVRQTISGFDNLLMTLWFQALAFGGASVVAVNPSNELGIEIRRIIESGALALSVVFFVLTLLYAKLLKRACEVAKQIEEEMLRDQKHEVKLTQYLDDFVLAGANKGKYFYLGASAVVPVFIALLLGFDLAGKFG